MLTRDINEARSQHETGAYISRLTGKYMHLINFTYK
jgi:hypothetical protein